MAEIAKANKLQEAGEYNLALAVLEGIPDPVIIERFRQPEPAVWVTIMGSPLSHTGEVDKVIADLAGTNEMMRWRLNIEYADALFAHGETNLCFKIYEEVLGTLAPLFIRPQINTHDKTLDGTAK